MRRLVLCRWGPRHKGVAIVYGDFDPGRTTARSLSGAHKLSVAMAKSSAKAKRRSAKKHLNVARAIWESISTKKVWKTVTNSEQPWRTPASQGNPVNS